MRLASPIAHLLQIPSLQPRNVIPPPNDPQFILQASNNHDISPFTKPFDTIVTKTLAHYNVTGLAVAIIAGEYTFAKGYGFAQLPDVPVTPETMFFGQSTTKAFTAAAVSLLVDDDEKYPNVKWTTPMNKLMPKDFVLEDDYYTRHVTIQDAACHRTGMPRHDFSIKGGNQSVKDVVRTFRFLPLTKPLRTTFQYCNLMFIALGHLVESLTGVWLGDFLAEKIWQPLGMDSTYFSLADALASGKPLARGYYWLNSSESFLETNYEDMRAEEGAGAVISSVLDYSKWIRMMINRNGPLSAQGHQELVTPHMIESLASETEPLLLYGYGWEIMQYKGFELIGHGGAGEGFGADVLYIPEKKWGCVLMSNTDLTSNVVTDIFKWMLIDDLLEVPQSQRVNRGAIYDRELQEFYATRNETWVRELLFPSRKLGNVSVSLPLEQYAGTYHNAAYGDMKLDYENGTLWNHKKRKIGLEWDAKFDHLSGDEFLVVGYLVNSPEDPLYTLAEFKVNVWGCIEQLGVLWEDHMFPEKIWFDRKGDECNMTLQSPLQI